MLKCKNCGRNDLLIIKKHEVCTNCYSKLRRLGLINVLSQKNPRPELIKADYLRGLKQRFGIDVVEDLNNLKTKPFFNLSSFGKKYGITRERARQIFSRYFNGESIRKYQAIKKQMIKDDLNNIACDMHPKIKHAEYKSHSRGLSSEALLNAFNICKNLRYSISFDKAIKSDMIVNNYKIKVRACDKAAISNNKYLYGIKYWRFFTNKRKFKDDIDFIIFYIKPQDEYYIIPFEKIENSRTTYIPIDERGCNKFLEYLGKWELLK